MTPRARQTVMLVAGGALLAFFVYGVAGLPDFGHYRGPYGLVINHVAGSERQVTNAVSSLVFDYRDCHTVVFEFRHCQFASRCRNQRAWFADSVYTDGAAHPLGGICNPRASRDVFAFQNSQGQMVAIAKLEQSGFFHRLHRWKIRES